MVFLYLMLVAAALLQIESYLISVSVSTYTYTYSPLLLLCIMSGSKSIATARCPYLNVLWLVTVTVLPNGCLPLGCMHDERLVNQSNEREREREREREKKANEKVGSMVSARCQVPGARFSSRRYPCPFSHARAKSEVLS